MSKTINRRYHSIYCECDQCGEGLEVEGTTIYSEATAAMKENEWVTRKIDDKWFDFCCEQHFYDYIKENK